MFSDDYVSEAEALADWEDDNCIVDEDEWYDDDFSYTHFKERCGYPKCNRLGNIFPKYAGFRKKKLGKKTEDKKLINEKSSIGDSCICPICGKTFIKKSYQQKFCGDKCRVKYHNKRKVYVW